MSISSIVMNSGINEYVRKEEKVNEKIRKEADGNARKLIDKNREKKGVSYEKSISDSVSKGLSYIQEMEKQFSGTKFFVGTASYGQTYGNSSDINFVVNPKFLEQLGTDETAREQFKEDINFLNDFSRRFREQQLANGREIVSQGWFCDENGNWGGWTISKPVNQGSVLQDMTDYAEKIRQEKLEEKKQADQELKAFFGDRFKDLRVKWLEEDQMEAEKVGTETAEEASESESESISTKIGVNAGKLARKISAAKTREQLQAVIAEIESDMQEVKDGITKGFCDETELEKVKMLMAMAQNRMGQVEDREATPEEENMFALASLM